MTDSEAKLATWFKGPAVPLADICMPCFGMDLRQAKMANALHRLPIPAFRLGRSPKAALAVHFQALAAFIDAMSPHQRGGMLIAGHRWGDAIGEASPARQLQSQARHMAALMARIDKLASLVEANKASAASPAPRNRPRQ